MEINLNFLGVHLKTDIQITSLAITSDLIAVSNGKTINVFEIIWSNPSRTESVSSQTFQTKLLHSFFCENEVISIYKKTIILLTTGGIQIRTLNGRPSFTINCTNQEGEPIGMDLNKTWLTIYTINGYIKICDLSKLGNSDTLIPVTKDVHEYCDDFGEIIWAKSNCLGTKVAFAVANVNLVPDQKLYFLDVENNLLEAIEYFLNKKVNETNGEELLNNRQVENYMACCNRLPLGFCWDTNDERLFICNAKLVSKSYEYVDTIYRETGGFYGVGVRKYF